MKKLAIASASLALAAMPVVGVFAATEGSFTDNITVTVAGGCTIGEAEGADEGDPTDRYFSKSIVNGTAEVLDADAARGGAPALEVVCNTSTASTFHINAIGTDLTVSGTDNKIEPGTAISGDVSTFAYSLDAGTTWNAVPKTSTAVVPAGQASSTTPFSFDPSYRVYVSLGQASGTYTGTVNYTLAMNA